MSVTASSKKNTYQRGRNHSSKGESVFEKLRRSAIGYHIKLREFAMHFLKTNFSFFSGFISARDKKKTRS